MKSYRVKKVYRWNLKQFLCNLSIGIIILGLSCLVLIQSTQANSEPEHVVVRQGDTVWQIALKTRPQKDPRHTVEAIRVANRLQTLVVTPGQALIVP